MSLKSPSPTLSNLIFRPWQIESNDNSDSNSCHSMNNPDDSLSTYFSSNTIGSIHQEKTDFPFMNQSIDNEYQSINQKYQFIMDTEECLSKDVCAVSESSSVTSSSLSVLNSLPQITLKNKKAILAKSKTSPQDSDVSSSRNFCQDQRSKNSCLFKNVSPKSLKRSFSEESSEEVKPRKMLKKEERGIYVPSVPSISGTIPPFFPGMPDPVTLFFSPSQMLHPNPHFNSLMPILEPQILIPAAEMERVCARRPRPKKFSCDECGAAFSNRGQLSGHCRIHTGERPYRCTHPSCGKRFTRNEELTRHRRIHSGLRPFACGVCPKRFGRKDHLKKHLRTHARHVLPQLQPLPPYNPLHFQHLQQFHHMQQIQQQFHMPFSPILPLQSNQRPL